MIKSNIKWMALLLFMPFVTACSWDDLPAYGDAEISAVQFYYRWASTTDTDPITGEPVVEEQQLTTSSSVDSDAATIEATVTVPNASGDFTETVRSEVTTSQLWGTVTVSTGARITPVDGSADLGTPDDWSETRKYKVTAADGSTKTWSITIVEFNK